MSYPSFAKKCWVLRQGRSAGYEGGRAGLIFYYRIINHPDFSLKQFVFKFVVKLFKQTFYVDG
jgi:hypothetical protein